MIIFCVPNPNWKTIFKENAKTYNTSITTKKSILHSHIIGKGVLDIIPNSKVLTQLVKSSLYNNTWKKEEGEED